MRRVGCVLLATPLALLVLLSAFWLTLHSLDRWVASIPASSVRRLGLSEWASAFRDAQWHHEAFNSSTEDVFFEGVYYKFVPPSSSDILVLIPGLFLSRSNSSASEAFLTVVHRARVNYYRFPPSAFRYEAGAEGAAASAGGEEGVGSFSIRIGDSHFTDRFVHLNVAPDGDDDALDWIRADIRMEEHTPWTNRFIHPSTMGVLGWLPGFQCYHHVLSMHHRLSGWVSLTHAADAAAAAGADANATATAAASAASDATSPVSSSSTDEGQSSTQGQGKAQSQRVDVFQRLDGGIGYLEKDWGSSFPSTWIWAQSNHFEEIEADDMDTRQQRQGNEEMGATHTHEEGATELSDPLVKDSPTPAAASSATTATATAARPVSLFLSVARVPLPSAAAWMSSMLGYHSPAATAAAADEATAEGLEALQERAAEASAAAASVVNSEAVAVTGANGNTSVSIANSLSSSSSSSAVHVMGFVCGFLFRSQLHIFASYQFDSLPRFTVDKGLSSDSEGEGDEKEVVHLSMVDAARTKRLDLALHKPVTTRQEREAIRWAREHEGEPLPSPSSSSASPNGTAASAAFSPTIVAGLYGPRDGRMDKYVKEALLGGHIELTWSALVTAEAYGAMTEEERMAGAEGGGEGEEEGKRGSPWMPLPPGAPGEQQLYASRLYRAIASPAALEVQGDTAWLVRESDHLNARVLHPGGLLQWLVQPHRAARLATAVLVTVSSAAIVWARSARKTTSTTEGY